MIGGTAAGLVFGVPGLTSAASERRRRVARSDRAAGRRDRSGGTDRRGPPPSSGTRLRETLQSLVDDGTITAEQADAVTPTPHRESPRRGERRENRGERRRGPGRIAVGARGGAGTARPDAEELREQLRAGSTLGEIATAQGVDPQAVVDAIVAEMTERVDAAVEDGKLDADAPTRSSPRPSSESPTGSTTAAQTDHARGQTPGVIERRAGRHGSDPCCPAVASGA